MCEPEALTWDYAWLTCVICGDRHLSIHCICPERLECAACGYMNPRSELEPVTADDAD